MEEDVGGKISRKMVACVKDSVLRGREDASLVDRMARSPHWNFER